MNVTQLPFNQLLNLQKCQDKQDGIFTLPEDPRYLNHVGTVHAAALFSLAEASGGQYLIDILNSVEDKLVPVLRRSDIQYIKPAEGAIYSRGSCSEDALETFHAMFKRRKRAFLTIQIELGNGNDVEVARASFEWFICEVHSMQK